MKVRTAVFATHGHAPFPPSQLFTCAIIGCTSADFTKVHGWVRGMTTKGFIDVPLCASHYYFYASSVPWLTALTQAAARSKGLPR